MFNLNYGDDRNVPVWSPQQLQQQHQQQQRQLQLIRQQQQQQQQQQQHHHQQQHVQQQQQQQQQQQLHHHHHHHLPQQRSQQHSKSTERLWADTPDVPDNVTVSAGGGFRSGSVDTTKSQVTPPLDLSDGPRHVESPLDLSVKTRKRCADTTDYGDIMERGGILMPEATLAKRQCLTKRDYAYPPGHPSHNIVQEHVAEKHHLAEISSLNKMVQQQHQQQKQQQHHQQQQQQLMRNKFQTGSQKYGPSVQHSPSGIVQQQYGGVERHVSQQQARQMQLAAAAAAGQPLRHHNSHHGSQQQVMQRRQSSPYDVQHPVAVQKPQQTNQTESVALKGFFEPTQKVTVNASVNAPMTSIQRQQQQPLPTMIPNERVLSQTVSRSMPVVSVEHKPPEEHRHSSSGYPHAAMYQRSPGNRLAPSATSPSGPVNELELMRQAQYQRQMQQSHNQKLQRESEMMMAKITQQKTAMTLAAQDQQRIAFMLEMQKHSEARKAQYPDKEVMSPYGSSMVRQACFPDSIRHEKTDIRCMKVGQPVSLPDIHPGHGLERIQSLPNQSDMYHARSQADHRTHVDALSANVLAASSIRNLPPSIRYEPSSRYRMSDQFDKPHAPGMSDAVSRHPSVIQRPQGYIPPRIVRRSESSDGGLQNRRPNERERVYPPTQQSGVPAEFNSEQMSVRHEMMSQRGRSQYGPNKDMLSGRDVLRIQQRAAEQRSSETQMPSKHHHSKTVETAGSSTYGSRYAERRRSLPDINDARPTSGEAPHNNHPNRERDRLMSPPGREMPGPSDRSSSKDRTCSPAAAPRAVPVLHSPPGRSITNGTSGMNKTPVEVDYFSKFLMRELKKTEDDDAVNPFANRSLLQEFDRSANSSPVHMSKQGHTETDNIKHLVGDKPATTSNLKDVKDVDESVNSKQSDSSYTLPLQIAIPGHKNSAQTPVTSEPRSSVISNPKQETPPAISLKAPRFMSRKQMILSAFRQEEDLNKNTVDIDKDEKVPVPIVDSAKHASVKTEKDSSHFCPPSPKMPILSPQERSRTTPLVSPAQVEQPPPNLENSSTGIGQNLEKGKEKMSSLEEHLHRMISNALNKESKETNEDVVEAVCREFQTQGHKIFVSRQTSLTRNIPVANVAPIVHGKVMPDSQDTTTCKSEMDDEKAETDTDAEDAKMAEVVTMSIFGERLGRQDVIAKTEQSNNDQFDEQNDDSITFENFNDSAAESPFDENSHSMRMSPGLKKLMLYRHRDIGETTITNTESLCKPESVHDSNENITASVSGPGRKRKIKENNRNVFGALNEIVAEQQCNRRTSASGQESREASYPDIQGTASPQSRCGQESTCWSGYQPDEDTTEDHGHTVLNTGYDGDDEQGRDVLASRRNKSNTQQKADSLIKKARHRRSTGDGSSRHALHKKRHAQRGFVDFMPQVLPRRTRPKHSSSLSPRKRSRSHLEAQRQRRPSTASAESKSPSKTRRRRASSLDRETKSKNSKPKVKPGFHSDNELEIDAQAKCDVIGGTSWNNADESTDEEYFQNEFKNFIRKGDEVCSTKKGPGASAIPKKKKGFHFKQKYIFQKKRKSNKGRGKSFNPIIASFPGGQLDEIYSFHEEGSDLRPLHVPPNDFGSHSNIPVPNDLKRVTVNKDTGETILHRAARMGFEEVVLYILATGSADINARDNAGYTALHECAVRGRVNIGKHLLMYGADVNVCSTEGGIRPIHDAVENDHAEMLRLLLSFGADPTLSTYAGKSLMKIARTDRMRNFIQDYACDLNGYESDRQENGWQFRVSCTGLEQQTGSGCLIFDNLPSDAEDESHEMFVTSSKPLFPVRRLAAESGKRVEDYLLLDDLLTSFGVNRLDFDSMEDHHRHQIKSISNNILNKVHTDSIFLEYFANKNENETTAAIRMVDSTSVISKLEKMSTISSRRSKC